jgi:hypothetical protein
MELAVIDSMLDSSREPQYQQVYYYLIHASAINRLFDV